MRINTGIHFSVMCLRAEGRTEERNEHPCRADGLRRREILARELGVDVVAAILPGPVSRQIVRADGVDPGPREE